MNSHSVDSCLRSAPLVDQWDTERLYDLELNPDSDEINTLIAVMKDYVFYCDGTISQWKFQWHLLPRDRLGKCTFTFTFSTLRPRAGSSCILTPVGRNSVTVRPDAGSRDIIMENIILFNVSVENRITVQAGDIVSLRVQSDRCDMKLWPGGTSSTNNTVYHETFDEGSALPNIFDDVTVCNSYNTDEVSPYITAIVGKEDKK